MKFTSDELEYVMGQRFSSSLPLSFEREPEDYDYRTRYELLINFVRGKQVIHIGCVGHGNVGTLHGHLVESAARCFGVDVDEAGIHHMRNKWGYEDVAAVDLSEETHSELMEQQWDYVLLPEVLEHIGNPVRFLEKIRDSIGDRVGQFVITVPNAFSLEKILLAHRGIESINTDHRFWFTPYTLAKVAQDAGLVPIKFIMCADRINESWLNPKALLRDVWLKRCPLLRKRIIMFFKVRSKVTR
ncbi:MAG: methyltransferase domain-containing protein [Pseudomonadales bacterium]